MNIQVIQNSDIDTLKELQPAGWSDIRNYFYYYSASPFCNPLKIVENGEIQALGTTICHSDSAWLAHIIVHPDHRNKGLGKEIVSALIERLDRERFRTVYLDATDLGYPVYKKIGFETETDYVHLDGSLTDLHLDDPASVLPFDPQYKDSLLELDKLISGEDRVQVLQDHLHSAMLFVGNGGLAGAYFPADEAADADKEYCTFPCRE
jgi:GNAT superfamily N-acetyltransferase